ncbi:hypothetical protein D9758_010109 [Tetrapyrgos nigripes]|uniref:Uncharacterized protein n=1 Tax=Tetrapyrgos nigripes TaxID=182062 RepID=A0A8H5CRZ9_9AGAR|nr:hypothetical protein D9758_010109 [Tetrapyrgos nigripes]
MDQNTSTIAELRAERVDQVSVNLASLDASVDADSPSSSPLPQRLQWAVERSKELFNELESERLVFVLPKMKKLMERANQTNGLDFRDFGEGRGRVIRIFRVGVGDVGEDGISGTARTQRQ